MDFNHYEYMYEIHYKKPNCAYTTVTHVGGNDEEEALANAINGAVSFHNKYNEPKITSNDIKIVSTENVGNYNEVLKGLQRG